MDYPDGVYLIKGIKKHLIFICYIRSGHRSAGVSLDKPIATIYIERWPYMSISETTEDFHITYVCSENFIHGMTVISPDIQGKDLLDQLGIDYTIRS